MIKNDKQLAVTVRQRDKFARAIRDVAARNSPDPLEQAYLNNLSYDLGKLEKQIEDYDRAISGKFAAVSIVHFDTIGCDLVSARIAAKLTQESLANMVDCKTQQIQRYEQSEYATASLAKLRQIASVLLAALPRAQRSLKRS